MINISASAGAFVTACRACFAGGHPEVVLELGSRDGGQAIGIARAFPETRVYSFECNPRSVEKARRYTQDFHNIEVVPKAAWRETGRVDFGVVGNGNDGASSLFRAVDGHPLGEYQQEFIQVDATRLDDWARIEGVTSVGAVFADLQGAELAALHGMGGLLNDVLVVQTGVQYAAMYEDVPLYQDMDGFMSGQGFACLTRTEMSDGWWGDCVYVRRVVA